MAAGLVGVFFAIETMVETGRLPEGATLVKDVRALGLLMFIGGFGGMFGARWAKARRKWDRGVLARITRVSWMVAAVGVVVMGTTFFWGLVVVLFFGG